MYCVLHVQYIQLCLQCSIIIIIVLIDNTRRIEGIPEVFLYGQKCCPCESGSSGKGRAGLGRIQYTPQMVQSCEGHSLVRGYVGIQGDVCTHFAKVCRCVQPKISRWIGE